MDERNESWPGYWTGKPLLAFVEHSDPVYLDGERTGKSLTLDVLRAEDLSRDEAGAVATSQIVVTFDGNLPYEFADFQEGTWHRVQVGPEETYDARLYRDLDEDAGWVDTRLSVGHPLPASAVEALTTIFSVERAAVARFGTGSVRGWHVAVINVGQGNCNAVCAHDGSAMLYFDLGAACLQNSRTRPPNLEFCFTNRPIVVLSHWDFDHWYGAEKSANEQHARPLWLAPSQSIGPRTQKFVDKLVADGRLLLWPDPVPQASFGGVTLVRCTGSSRNDSGIALWVRTLRGVVLCPGDAEFGFVPIPPSARGRGLAGLVATHHGSTHVGNPVPKPTPGATIAFSFGANNSFGHPSSSRALYQAEGWTRQFDTVGGSIALGAPHGATTCSVAGIAGCGIVTVQS